MATQINRFGYIINKEKMSEDEIVKMRENLTVKPYKPGNFGRFAKDNSFAVFLENKKCFSIPKYYGLQHVGQPEVNKLETYEFPTFDMQYLGQLRPRQEIIAANIIKGFETHRGGLLVAACGIGKTNLAIYIACHYKLKTLFIVHKEFLKRQASDRIKETTNVKQIGTIQRQTMDTDHPFVIAMVHSLAKIDYDHHMFKDFGLIIIDEVHHMAAKNFSNVFRKMTGKYMLGISAEKSRMDGLYKIINWYMGPILHEEPQKPNDMVVVKKIHFRSSNEKRTKVIVNKYTQEPDRSTMITNLVMIKKRNILILNMLKQLFDEGKNVLFLTGRIKHVNLFYRLLTEDPDIVGSVGKYIGSMSDAELEISSTKQIILGTFAMAEEGLDIANLNVVILSTPKSATKQSIGRILRKEVYETHPIVIDIEDEDNSIFVAQSKKRNAYYSKQQYQVQHFFVADYDREKYNLYDDIDFINKCITTLPDKQEVAKFHEEQNQYNDNIDIDNLDFLSEEEN
jgi:superfamily II DNA or RNA helicase